MCMGRPGWGQRTRELWGGREQVLRCRAGTGSGQAGSHGGRQWCLQREFTRWVTLVIFRYLSGKRNKRKADQPKLQRRVFSSVMNMLVGLQFMGLWPWAQGLQDPSHISRESLGALDRKSSVGVGERLMPFRFTV